MKWVVVITLLFVFFGHAQIVEWVARYNELDDQPEQPYDITADNSGNVYVCGFGYRDTTWRDYLTIKYNSAGDTVWVRYYDGGQEFYDDALAIAVDDAGNVYVTGRSMESGNQMDIATIKYNSAGIEQWVARYDGPDSDDDEGWDIAIDDSGYIYVTGYTRSATTYLDWITIKYDNAGDTVWTATHNGPGNGFDEASALALDDSGNVYVTGYTYSATAYFDYTTIKYDADGDTQWVVAYDGTESSADDKAVDIAIGGGYVYVTGTSEGTGTAEDYVTVKYSPAGDTLWEMSYDGLGNADDNANAVAADSLGNVYVTGGSVGTSYFDYATVKYNFSGNIEWVSRYDGPDHDIDEAMDIVVDHMGNVFVAGQSYATQPGTPEFDYLTIQYNSSGVEQWTHRYNGTGDSQDHLYAMAADDAGNVYVTGRSIGTASLEDIVTIKYGVTGITEGAGYEIRDTGYKLTVQPNPFTYSTAIRYQITDNRQKYELKIYDITGRLVTNLSGQISVIGYQSSVRWSGVDDANRKLGSGVYFVTLEAGDYQETCRILLIR
jgi:hypothetical protein